MIYLEKVCGYFINQIPIYYNYYAAATSNCSYIQLLISIYLQYLKGVSPLIIYNSFFVGNLSKFCPCIQ